MDAAIFMLLYCSMSLACMILIALNKQRGCWRDPTQNHRKILRESNIITDRYVFSYQKWIDRIESNNVIEKHAEFMTGWALLSGSLFIVSAKQKEIPKTPTNQGEKHA
ncbi:MAG: hypothetical protein U1C33_08275 [Candidatus Cloacimonadaceae bacterium]|nr:hypothetical protein [Candidatus Cloacimonadaceae bacterium]